MKYPSSYFRWNPSLRAYQCECGAVLFNFRSRWYHIKRSRKHAALSQIAAQLGSKPVSHREVSEIEA